MAENKKVIAVVGAGIFGVSAANHLARELPSATHTVKLITASDYVYFLPSAVRLTISDDYSNSILPLKDVLDSEVEVIKEKAVSFSQSSIVLESNSTLEFDVLILATGSKWPDPIGSTYAFGNDYKSYFENEATKVKKAEHILFIGGGFVNSEIAGEFLFKYGDDIRAGRKRISIVHSSDKLLPGNGPYSDKLRSKVTEYLLSHGIKLYLNTKGVVSDSNPNRAILKDSTVEYIDADLIYTGTGITPNVPLNDISNLCDSSGFVRVEKNFQVKAAESGNIFAIGDVTDFKYHGVIKRDNWVNTITANVISYLKEGKNARLTDANTYESGHIPSVVSLGQNAGYGQLPVPLLGTLSVPTFLAVYGKSKKLFSEKMKGAFAT